MAYNLPWLANTASQPFPMSWDDPVFANVTDASSVVINTGDPPVSNKSVDTTSGDAAIFFETSGTVSYIRVRAREGIRVQSGTVNISWVFIDINADLPDHGDGLQCYTPNGTGTVTLTNSTIRVNGTGINGNYFSGDDWEGSHVLENVLFWDGNKGFMVDGSSDSISLKNVYFVENTISTPIEISPVNSRLPTIVKWENVRYVTVVDGQVIPGDLISQPY